MKIKLSEKEIQNQIIEFLHLKNVFVWRNNTGAMKTPTGFMRFGKVGSPDLIGVLPDGKFLGIEVKRKGGKTTEAQKTFLRLLRKNKALAIVAYSLDDVIKALKLNGYL